MFHSRGRVSRNPPCSALQSSSTMSQTGVNNKRIAKNTLFLYIRTLLIMAVSLYTSRVILQTLGVEDFGIYNIVGGLATSFVFFSSSLSNAIQRFLNVELGKNSIQGASRIFNQSILIYTLIIIVVIIVAECVGVWLINHKLVIPFERLNAARWVFHTTIIGLAATLMGSVFDSVLIARENIKIYAYISIIEVFLKLFIVYALSWGDFDKLKLYGVLLLLAHLFIKSISVIYCIRKYPECKLHFIWDTHLLGDLFRFIGWNGLGTAVWMINEQGYNILINIFFGPVVNAARGVSAQVSGAISSFSSNLLTAVRPQIVKSYANGNYSYFTELINHSSKYSFFLIWLLSLPIILRSEAILQLWLGNVPNYASEFIQWILFANCITTLTNPLWSGVQAVGKLKKYIIVGGFVSLSALPISYIFLRLQYSPIIVFQVLTLTQLACLFVRINIFRQLVTFSIVNYFIQVIYPIVKVSLLSGILSVLISPYVHHDLWGILLMTLICLTLTIFSIYTLGISKEEQHFLTNKIRKLINRHD